MPNRANPPTMLGGVFLVISAILVAVGIAFSAADPELTYSSELVDNSRDIQVTCTDEVSDGRGRPNDAPLLDAGDHFRSRYTVIKGELELTDIQRAAREEAKTDQFAVHRGINADCAAARSKRLAAAVRYLGAAAGALLLAILTTAVLRPGGRDRKISG